MNTTDHGEMPYQGSSIDQLTHTIDLISCGILDFALIEQPTTSINELRVSDNFVEINDNLEQARNLLNSLPEDTTISPMVERINQAIREIAEQTNLLALDAAIQAARAEKYHPGLSSVAGKFHALAGRADATTKMIVQLVQMNPRDAFPMKTIPATA